MAFKKHDWIFVLVASLVFGCQGKKDAPQPESKLTPEEKRQEWASSASFKAVAVSPGTWSYKDIVFHKDVGALLDNDNRIYFSYDDGANWTERLKITAATLQSIALKPDGEQLFIGGISQGPYVFGAKFWVYNTPKGKGATIDYDGEAKMANIDEPINHDFQRTQWNGDGSVYASFGRQHRNDGFFGNITPDGRKIFSRRTPSQSFIMGNNPTRFPSHCGGFVIKNNSETTMLCTYEYIPSANMNLLAPYQSNTKGSGNSWLPLANYWQADFVYHIGQDPAGIHAVFVSQGNRLFYEGRHLINPSGLQGEAQCAAIDHSGYLWVGTSSGLYKSTNKMPDLSSW